MGHSGPFNHPAKFNIYDAIHVAYSVKPKDRIKSLIIQGIPPTQRGIIIKYASTMMHELGHSIGISHRTFEGCDNLSYLQDMRDYKEKWGNYWSVMNYFHMYKTKLLDYSDGSNGPPYDQNDWDKLFVANFQYSAELVEEIYYAPPGFDKIVYGETETTVTGYVMDEELTDEFTKSMGEWSPVEPIKVNWLVFKLKDKEEYPNFKDVKILVQPDVPLAGWAEYAEGNFDDNGEIQFYSQQALVEETMDLIK
jgi:hypothetical protein